MIEQNLKIKAPVAWLPSGLISWYGPGGLPVALVTAWIALVAGDSCRIRTAWHGRHDPLACLWTGGDFVLNVPYEDDLVTIREIMSQGKLCLNAEVDLGYACTPGVTAVAPRLLDCAVQIECVGGRLIDTGFEENLCGDVVLLHREQIVFDPANLSDLCAIHPLSPLETA